MASMVVKTLMILLWKKVVEPDDPVDAGAGAYKVRMKSVTLWPSKGLRKPSWMVI